MYQEKQLHEESKEREQDSLRQLLETGQVDTIHYVYEEQSGIQIEDGKLVSWIEVKPRIDPVENRLGDKSFGIVWLLLGITMLLAFVFGKQAAKYVYKKKFFSAPLYYGLHLMIGLLVIYPILSSIYTNLDDMMIRQYGNLQEASLSDSWAHHAFKPRNGGSNSSNEYSFLFPQEDGVMISVNQGKAAFDDDCYRKIKYGEEGNNYMVLVRYDKATQKLSVEDNACFMWNLYEVVFMCFILLLFFGGSCGKFNKFFCKIGKKFIDAFPMRGSFPKSEAMGENLLFVDMPCLLSTLWTFTSKEYESVDEFVRDVRQAEKALDVDADRLTPDRIALKRPSAIVRVFNEDIIGDNNMSIELRSDNGENFTEGELLFKLHNQMIPFVDRLANCTMKEIDLIMQKDISKDEQPECVIFFTSL